MVDTSSDKNSGDPFTDRSSADSTRETLRKQILVQRRALTDAQQNTAANNLLFQVTHWPALQQILQNHRQQKSTTPLRVGAYLAVGGEINPAPVLAWLQSMDVQTLLPVIRQAAATEHLLFAPVTSTTPLRSGRYGIQEPDLPDHHLRQAIELDLVLVPLVSFDSLGNRLGMGGGYYDRTFSFRQKESNNRQIFAGIAHEQQKIKTVPAEIWDVPLDVIITDTTIHSVN